MKVLWRSDAISCPVGQEVRIIDLDGEKIIESSISREGSFFDRLRVCLKYLFGSKELNTSFVVTDDKFREMCERVVENGREDC